MDYDTYSSGAVQLAVDLANTQYDDPGTLAEFLAEHREWFARRTRLTLTAAERETVADLGRRVRAVVAADKEQAVVDRLNDLLRCANVHPRMTTHDGTLHVHYSRDSAAAVEQLSTTVAVGMAMLVTRYGWARLGICGADDCQSVFVDTSRNNSRRFCSETCASRASVAAYRARQREAGAEKAVGRQHVTTDTAGAVEPAASVTAGAERWSVGFRSRAGSSVGSADGPRPLQS